VDLRRTSIFANFDIFKTTATTTAQPNAIIGSAIYAVGPHAPAINATFSNTGEKAGEANEP